jgi:3,4-dihydroxy 2-butanone 4-phosphate synthase/GTP cyclohydrolase II
MRPVDPADPPHAVGPPPVREEARREPIGDAVESIARGADEQLDSIEDAIRSIARGELVVVVDDPGRENEGDLVMAAAHATPERVNFMATHARGLICAPLPSERLRELGIPPIVATSGDRHGTAFHVGVDHRRLATTGISAADRAHAVRALADPAATAADFVAPGHIFPLGARPRGVLERAGHTEAAVDLARLAGLPAAGLICEIASDDGSMARLPELLRFARRHGLRIASVRDLVAYRRIHDTPVRRVVEATLPLPHGAFRAIGYDDLGTGSAHVAFVLGDLASGAEVLGSVHARCYAGDVLRSERCGCRGRLDAALAAIARHGTGVVVYVDAADEIGAGDALDRPSAGDGAALLALAADAPCPNARVDRSDRPHAVAARILRDLGAGRATLLGEDVFAARRVEDSDVPRRVVPTVAERLSA